MKLRTLYNLHTKNTLFRKFAKKGSVFGFQNNKKPVNEKQNPDQKKNEVESDQKTDFNQQKKQKNKKNIFQFTFDSSEQPAAPKEQLRRPTRESGL